jgi:hypothetical protein
LGELVQRVHSTPRMSKVECTAVNELIDLVQQKPLSHDTDDLFSAPRPHRLRGTEPPALFAVELPALPQPAPRPIASKPREHAPAPMHLSSGPIDRSSYIPLSKIGRRFALPVAGLVGLGILGGVAYTIFASHGQAATGPSASEVALTAAAAVPPLPKPAPLLLVAPPAPKLVDVRLDSTPPGATATLLSNGSSTPLGSTPVEASVDPTKSYDVVFAFDGQPSKVEHLDPSTTLHVEVAFEAPAPVVAVKSSKKSRRHHAPAARVAAAAPSHHAKAATVAAAPAAAPAAPGDPANGTLSITTNPPAAILIDDLNTGFTSPHTISVPAGHHNVRLIAATIHVNKLVPVDITAHHTSRISQDFTK